MSSSSLAASGQDKSKTTPEDSFLENLRSTVKASGQDARVEVNQRALIDKILARYATAGAVYRELLQNSNDAEATVAEIYFRTAASSSNTPGVVTQVTYRNNGIPFRKQDWSRLQKIAEGNPDVSKVGAFGVGAYTMFSICEEPLVVSGTSALAFVWKGDALWTRVADAPPHLRSPGDEQWTTFVLPSRDPYPLPDWVDFGQFLAASLTFTACLKHVQVFVNHHLVLSITKTPVQEPTLVKPPPHLLQNTTNNNTASSSSSSALSWLFGNVVGNSSSSSNSNNNSTSNNYTSICTKSPHGVFYLNKPDQCIYESVYQLVVQVWDLPPLVTPVAATSSPTASTTTTLAMTPSAKAPSSIASTEARYISAVAHTNVPADVRARMERVTKKQPPTQVNIQLFFHHGNNNNRNNRDNTYPNNSKKSKLTVAEKIVRSFSPADATQGRIFIGFRTSQTTGFAAHLAAPFCPTVEREAMDLQDVALRLFNTELLHIAGIVMRLTLHHAFRLLHYSWQETSKERDALEKRLLEEHQREASQAKKGIGAGPSTAKAGANHQEEATEDEEEDDAAGSKGGFLGFARFMARGVKKKLVTVVNTAVEQTMSLTVDESAILFNPPDPRPLCSEEETAIQLMQSYCPQPSTPDPNIGMCLANGFSLCMPDTAPPVLTKSGVQPGDKALLPHYGMEAFVTSNVIRSIVYQNAVEYHTVIAGTREISLQDLMQAVTNTCLTQDQLVTLLKWWTKYSRIDTAGTFRAAGTLKEQVRFWYESDEPTAVAVNNHTNASKNAPGQSQNFPPSTQSPQQKQQQKKVCKLSDLLFYVEKDSLLSPGKTGTGVELPLPETVIPVKLQDAIGLSTLQDPSMKHLFEPLPMEIWTEYISHHPTMTEAKPEDEKQRIEILSILNKEYQSRHYPADKAAYANFCQSLLANKRCIPFDSDEPVTHAAERPGDLYLYSAELKAFESVGSFFKVAASLKAAGVSEEFLLALGVRKSVSIDFLFANLDTLKWSNDPKSLVEYLRSASLTNQDRAKLAATKYLPAEKDTQTYAPSELYLPSPDLRLFPFCKQLQWPSESEISERSENGKFLISLGMMIRPSLSSILQYLQSLPTAGSDEDKQHRKKVLDYLAERLAPNGVYHRQYVNMPYSQLVQFHILPCTIRLPLEEPGEKTEFCSPVACFTRKVCGVLGFPVLDPSLEDGRREFYGSVFKCAPEPMAADLLRQLRTIVSIANRKVAQAKSDAEMTDWAGRIDALFASIFMYLSQRSSDFTAPELDSLKTLPFIPSVVQEQGKTFVKWFTPDQVFFRQPKTQENKSKTAKTDDGNRDNDESLTEELFPLVEFSPFLAAAGVKRAASTRDLFILMLQNPKHVLETLGSEKKYRTLLRRIAANPPFSRVTPELRTIPFLLAYTLKAENTTKKDGSVEEEVGAYHLAAAKDIYIIDNSFFGRMFPVNRAPHESDLEDFYVLLGSTYISKSVGRRFEVVGKPSENTPLTKALKERVLERSPLLVSPTVTTRPLVAGAASVMSENRLDFYEASSLMAVYSLEGHTRRNKTTCFSRQVQTLLGKKNAIFVVEDFDWFDVGYAIGDLILQRCQLEDAFFISSLLEAPLEQLRARGFPVDRIMKPVPTPEPPKPEPTPEPPKPTAQAPVVSASGLKNPSASPSPTIASIPPEHSQAAAPTMNANGSAASAARAQPQVEKDTPDVSPSHASVEPNKQPSSNGGTDTDNMNSPEAYRTILQQMFPDADPEYIHESLGPNPSLDDVRALTEEMATGNYPRRDDSSESETVASSMSNMTGDTSAAKRKKDSLRKKLGRAFGGLRMSSAPPLSSSHAHSHGGGAPVAGPSTGHAHESRSPVSPAHDAQSQQGLEGMLENAVKQSSKVNPQGIQSNETTLTSVPEGLDRGDSCEVLPGNSLKPFAGPTGTGKSTNGIRLFSAKTEPSSEAFMIQNSSSIESFAVVIERLCGVYGLKLDSVALYHDPVGGTIAFNSGKALYFNLRFFHSLHFLPNKQKSRDCYSYWFITMAHELAHHMVSGHTKEHGFYTESYAVHYLPKLIALLASL